MKVGTLQTAAVTLLGVLLMHCDSTGTDCAAGDPFCNPVAGIVLNQTAEELTAATGGSSGDGSGGGAGSTPTNNCEILGKCIFLTPGTNNGEFELYPGATPPDTIGGADLFCADQKPSDLVGTYKAMIVDGQSDADGRVATSGSQNNWVLVSGTSYYRYDDGAFIATADVNNQFTFPLSVPFSTLGSGRMWTGLATSWASTASRCIDSGAPSVSWDSGLNAQLGRVGDVTSMSNTSIDSGGGDARACDQSYHVLCVQQ